MVASDRTSRIVRAAPKSISELMFEGRNCLQHGLKSQSLDE